MQDIRKPYSHSKSNRDINSRVEAFERHEEIESIEEPVAIPTRSFRTRRNLENMEMFPRRERAEAIYDRSDIRDPSDRAYDPNIDTDPHTPYRGSGERRRSTGSMGTWIFVATTTVIVGGVALLTFVFNSATITFTPKFKDVEINKSFVFSTTTGTAPITYTLATSTISKTKTLPLSDTRKVEAKASGSIIVYNNFDANPQKLIKNTRFEATNGKIYRINQSITIPGKVGTTPGSVEVTVYADSYGADYNIAPSDFTIPGFKGTPRYTGFYARSTGTMKGGASGNMSLASQSDLDAAKDELAIEMTQAVKENLKKVTKEGSVPMYDAITVAFTDNEDKVMTGVTSVYEVTATGYLMLANESELASAVASETMREYVNQPVKIDYTNELTFTLKQDAKPYTDPSLEVLVEGKPRVILVTDTEALKTSFLGKSRSDAPAIVQNIPSVSQIEMSFFPLWLSTIPTDKSHISIVESLPKR